MFFCFVLFCFALFSCLVFVKKVALRPQILKVNNTENYAAQGRSKQTQVFLNNLDKEGEPVLIRTSGVQGYKKIVVLKTNASLTMMLFIYFPHFTQSIMPSL